MKRPFASKPPSRRRMIAAGLLAPAAAVGIARALGPDNLAAATALCLLAVVAAAALGGRGAGLVASIVSFIALNFFFTEPRHTLVVQEASDLLALIAFLLAGLIVGTLFSRVLEEGTSAERRATEARFLSQTTAKLISGEAFGRILDGFAAELVVLFALARCEISTPHASGAASSQDEAATEGSSVTLPLTTQSGSFGSITLVHAADASDFSGSEIQLLKSLASQTALAIERAALDAEVRHTRLEAEASQLRAALFSSVTHDLRTPLSSIKADASGLLAKDARYTESQRQEVLRTIVSEADHLNRIVGNLLDLARMRAGALLPTTQPILVEELVGSVLGRMKQTLDGAAIRTNIRPQLPPVDADPVQIGQVLSNLLENALRFSPHDRDIVVTAARWQDSVQICIADHGPGIPPEDRETVFEEFFRRDAGTGRGGTGLGLSIARAIVLAHGGRIWVTDTPGGGASMLFDLPIAKSPRAPAPVETPRQEVGR